jgi:uncharacterized protein involved in outer membrane biogenesis
MISGRVLCVSVWSRAVSLLFPPCGKTRNRGFLNDDRKYRSDRSMTVPSDPVPGKPRRFNRWYWAGGVSVILSVAIGLLVFSLGWKVAIPLLETRASAAVGRQVKIESLEVHPGRTATIVLHGLRIAGPDGFNVPDVATADRVTVVFEAATWFRTRKIVLPRIEIEQPSLDLIQTGLGHDNWTFPALAADPNGSSMEIGDLVITGGAGHLEVAEPAADVALTFATGGPQGERTLIVDAQGMYARQPISVKAVGGALLNLTETDKPYPVDITLANGPTRATVKGTVKDPLAWAGAELSLTLSGPDMELLYPLTGIPIPKTPPYTVSGKLDFANNRVAFSGIKGKVGSSDLNGALDVDLRGARPLLTGALNSRQVDMQDLAGFIGSEPGRTSTPGQTARQIEDVRRAEANPKLLPTRTISVPKLLSMDIHIQYRGDKVVGKDAPFDAIAVTLDINAGHIRLDPLHLAVGGGTVAGYIDLNPIGNALNADVDVRMAHVNLGGFLAKAGLGSGQGPVNGLIRLKGRGASMAEIVGHGEGAFQIVMPAGGQVNALLIDLSGGEVPSALLALIGIPSKESIRCMVADFVLHDGILASRMLAVDTADHIVTGGGRIDLTKELVEMHLRTDAKHFTIGKLGAPIAIYGPFKKLSYGLDADAIFRDAGGLGLLFPKSAILPTIAFGVGDDSPCAPKQR